MGAHYISSQELGAAGRNSTGNAQAKRGAVDARTKGDLSAKYRDKAGNEWVGRMARPLWLRKAVSCKTLKSFLVKQ